jgi:hypothetical protein
MMKTEIIYFSNVWSAKEFADKSSKCAAATEELVIGIMSFVGRNRIFRRSVSNPLL